MNEDDKGRIRRLIEPAIEAVKRAGRSSINLPRYDVNNPSVWFPPGAVTNIQQSMCLEWIEETLRLFKEAGIEVRFVEIDDAEYLEFLKAHELPNCLEVRSAFVDVKTAQDQARKAQAPS